MNFLDYWIYSAILREHTFRCGPIEPATWDGMKYFVTVLDDYTHFAVVFPIRGKYEVSDILEFYIKQCEVKWNSKVSKLKCDNGKEYMNRDLIKWSKDNGIILDFTPQLNSKAERLNRIILDKTKALLIDAKINKNMSVRTVVYLINRSPTNVTVKTSATNFWLQCICKKITNEN